jgi:hypothetical protein
LQNDKKKKKKLGGMNAIKERRGRAFGACYL